MRERNFLLTLNAVGFSLIVMKPHDSIEALLTIGDKMSTAYSNSITLEEIIPLVDRLSEVERDALRQILESKTRVDWKAEWEKAVARFHQIFAKFPEDEVAMDLAKALNEVRSGHAH